jgi:hypothetical protein
VRSVPARGKKIGGARVQTAVLGMHGVDDRTPEWLTKSPVPVLVEILSNFFVRNRIRQINIRAAKLVKLARMRIFQMAPIEVLFFYFTGHDSEADETKVLYEA